MKTVHDNISFYVDYVYIEVTYTPYPDTPPVADPISPAAFEEDTESLVTLSYSDVEANLATDCTGNRTFQLG